MVADNFAMVTPTGLINFNRLASIWQQYTYMHDIAYRIALFILALPLAAGHARAEISLAGNSVHYSGSITAENNQLLFKTVKQRDINRLVITSSGGEVVAGIALGTWVAEHGIDIEVPAYCLSSCANYVFPAADTKSIAPGAVVAWHGNYHHLQQTGLWRDEIATRMLRHDEDAATAEARVREQVDRLAGLEEDFFTRIGIDEYLCWIGKMPPYSVPNYYFLSANDMARFGVSGVKTPPDYKQTDVSGFDVDIRYIKLEQYRSMQPAR